MWKKFLNWLRSLFKATPPVVVPPPVEPPVVEPPAGGGCYPMPDGPNWVPVESGVSAELTMLVRQTTQETALGATPEESLENLAKAIRAKGYCAGRMTDAVFVMRPDGLWEEHHAVYYGTNVWLTNTFRGVWKYAAV